MSHDTSHVFDLFVVEDWLVVNIGIRELEDIVGPVFGRSSLMNWRGFIVNAAASECQEAFRRKHLGIAKVYGALNETGTKDVAIDHVVKFLGQTEEAALRLLADSWHAVVIRWPSVVHSEM